MRRPPLCRGPRFRRGMTLVELLVAILILSIVTLLGFTGYRLVTLTLERQGQSATGRDAALAAIDQLRTDLGNTFATPADGGCPFTLQPGDDNDTVTWDLAFCSRRRHPETRDAMNNDVWSLRYWTETDPDGSRTLYRSERRSGVFADGLDDAATNLLLAGAATVAVTVGGGELAALPVWPPPGRDDGQPPALLRIDIAWNDKEPFTASLLIPAGLVLAPAATNRP